MNSATKLERLGGTGPDVLLLHGYGSDRQSWLATAPALFETHTVWVMDLPAHGQSSSDCGDGSINALANSVLQAADDAMLKSFHLIGHSLGGRISMHLAGHAPERIKSLVAFAPAGLGHRINTDFLSQFSSAEQVDTLHPLLLSLVHDQKMISRALATSVLAYLEKPGIREALSKISAGIVDAQQNVEATVSAIHAADIPRMIIWGANDSINPISNTKAQAFGGRLHVFDDCGHLPHIERRVAVNTLLQEFYA